MSASVVLSKRAGAGLAALATALAEALRRVAGESDKLH